VSYEVKESRAYPGPASAVAAAVQEEVVQLGGKLAKASKPAEGYLEANFNKEVGGKSFGNRVQLVVRVAGESAERCALTIDAYPVDPLGKKLLFGVLGAPAKLVIDALCARLDARLGKGG